MPMLNEDNFLVKKMYLHLNSETNAQNTASSFDRRSFFNDIDIYLADLKGIAEEIKHFQNLLKEIPSEYIPIRV
ncbi:hypothetical protein DP120_17150 [Planococcus halotolerans]|uniref:Uncharacterized protein n=1 Tax=Planococcus halotolerans TaxID=2233542 RepID=A0A365KK72_9BACL|nr:hypothetical protein DP120_17150 [Planococcus halotolerans]